MDLAVYAVLWNGLANSMRLRPGDVIFLTLPAVWALDGTSRMSMAVERAHPARCDATAAATLHSSPSTTSADAAADQPLSHGGFPGADTQQHLQQLVSEGSQPGSSFSVPGVGAPVEPVEIVLNLTACSYNCGLQLTCTQAAALMPPNSQVHGISGACADCLDTRPTGTVE